ncbi:MAG: 30S ribosomal protein S12 methylthiotransferase RimO [Ruminococcaceae bacterium]|nr:30S ribosomal protein S12 methylthiotransferase RimO [Oscillospiraceae bacterium]
MKTKIGFISLGCPKNQIDTEIMLRRLIDKGYEITSDETDAEIVIINTCGFTEEAKKESIDNILDIAWLKEHGKLKKIIVTGCMAQRYPEEIRKEMPEVDGIVGVGSIKEIEKAVEAAEKGEFFTSLLPNDELELGGDRVLTTPDYTAYLKIAEGCDNRCAFCAIPGIRGRFRSRPMEDILAEAKELEAMGVKELTLVAQDTTRYGLDLYGSYKTAELIEKLLAETSIPWIRTLYCYPDKITDDFLRVMRDNDRVVKYVDMPIQHVTDRMLKAMNRHGDSQVVKSAVKRLREQVPGITLRTTLMVGFPGETQEDFDALCEYIAEARFDRLGVFAFSPEEGTAAYEMKDQIDEQTKQDRMDRAMDLQYDIHASLNEEKVGRTIRVLCEGFDPVSESFYGRSEADAPEIDGKIYFSAKRRIAEGEFVDVTITETLDYDLIGEAK